MAKKLSSVLEPVVDDRVTKTESLVGKYDNATLIDSDLIDWFDFPCFKNNVYMEDYTTTVGNHASQPKPDYRGLKHSTLLNLRDLQVFGTTGVAMQCTKLLLSRIQGGSLWLGREIPITTEDIHRLTGLSQEGREVSMAFQTDKKRVKKDPA